ncbi:MAG: helix-turn-helix domain-containing protein [Asticcacaulis sp.]
MDASSSLPFLEIKSSQANRGKTFEDYEEAINPIFDVQINRENSGEPLVTLKTFNIGPLLLGHAEMQGAHFHYTRQPRKIAQTSLDLLLIQIITEGSDIRTPLKDSRKSMPGDVCVMDLTRTFRSEAQLCSNFTLAIPRMLVSQNEAQLDSLHGQVFSRDSVVGRLFHDHVRSLWSLAHHVALEEAERAARGTINLFSALALQTPDQEARAHAVEAAQLVRIRRYIEQSLVDRDLDPLKLCREFGLSRASLYRLFAPLGGVSDYIRNRRLQLAFRLLTNPAHFRRSLSAVAHDCGFNDWSGFSRAFKSKYGFGPGEARELGQTDYLASRQDNQLDGPRRLPAWLRALDQL